jgi:hypothetical protein
MRSLIAYLAASVTAALTLVTFILFAETLQRGTEFSLDISDAFFGLLFLSAIVASVMALPTFAFVVLMAGFQRLSLIACILFGSLGGIAALMMFSGQLIPNNAQDAEGMSAIALSGAVAGLVYWLIALRQRPDAALPKPDASPK